MGQLESKVGWQRKDIKLNELLELLVDLRKVISNISHLKGFQRLQYC